MTARFCDFDGVVGYATRANAVKRGNVVAQRAASAFPDAIMNWTILGLPNGRFAPCFIINQTGANPGWFFHQTNICVIN